MFETQPSDVEGSIVVVVVHLGFRVADLARLPGEFAPLQVDPGVRTGVVATTLILRQGVGLAPFPHVLGVARAAVATLTIQRLRAFRAFGFHVSMLP